MWRILLLWRIALGGFLVVFVLFFGGFRCVSFFFLVHHPLTDMSSAPFSSGKVSQHKYTASQQFIIDQVFAKDGPGRIFWSDSLKLGPQVDALGIGMCFCWVMCVC